MKNVIILLTILIGIAVSSCGKESLKYDFAKVESQSELKALLAKMQLENKEEKIDSISDFQEITIQGMHYGGVPVKTALITNYYTNLTTDTLNFSGKKLLEAIEAKKGLTKRKNTYNDDIEFEWKTETEDIEFELTLRNGKHLAKLGDKDNAEVTIRYKTVYEVPLANIHNEVKTFENQPVYQYQINTNSCVYDMIFNDILILESSDKSSYVLNNFITSEHATMKIVVKPSSDSNGNTPNSFQDSANFSITIIDKSTGKTIKEIERTALSGSTPVTFKLDFNSTLPYYPKAWTDGADLREDKNLKEKIIALYDKLGKAELAKDVQTINELCYQKNFETQQVNYNSHFSTAREAWEGHLAIQNNSYKYTVAKDFDIEFNADGRLIYTHPKSETEMLVFTGKQYFETMYYYVYQPKGSNELKIIR